MTGTGSQDRCTSNITPQTAAGGGKFNIANYGCVAAAA